MTRKRQRRMEKGGVSVGMQYASLRSLQTRTSSLRYSSPRSHLPSATSWTPRQPAALSCWCVGLVMALVFVSYPIVLRVTGDMADSASAGVTVVRWVRAGLPTCHVRQGMRAPACPCSHLSVFPGFAWTSRVAVGAAGNRRRRLIKLGTGEGSSWRIKTQQPLISPLRW